MDNLNLRIGTGFDVHPLKVGRDLIIGGLRIPHTHGLDGHSDADVLVHAIMDAILGAANLGDIGEHFPDNDDNFKGANSIELLKFVKSLIDERGFRIINIDSVIIAQEPKMSPFRSQMQSRIADALDVSVGRIGIKATTTEMLGFVGRKEAIAASAVALLEKRTKQR